MTTWCMSHPWMISILVLSAIYFTYHLGCAICETICNSYRAKVFNKMCDSGLYTKEEITESFKSIKGK